MIDLKLRETEDRKVAEALNAVEGMKVTSVFDLVNTRKSYPQAIPVLLEFVESGLADPLVMEGVVRALTVKEAAGIANNPLLELYHRLPKEDWSLKWAIGNAIKKIISPNDLQAVVNIVRDKAHGMTRQEFVSALAKVPNPEVEHILVELLDDDDVAGHALEALRKRKSQHGYSKAKKLLNHPKLVISREARKYITQTEKR